MKEYQVTVERGLGAVKMVNRETQEIQFAAMTCYPGDVVDIIFRAAVSGSFHLTEDVIGLLYGPDMDQYTEGVLDEEVTFMALESSLNGWEVRVRLRDSSIGSIV